MVPLEETLPHVSLRETITSKFCDWICSFPMGLGQLATSQFCSVLHEGNRNNVFEPVE